MKKCLLLVALCLSLTDSYGMDVVPLKAADQIIPNILKLQLSNQSEQIVSCFSSIGASNTFAPILLPPYQDSATITVMKSGCVYINNLAGSFILEYDKDNQSVLVLYQLITVQNGDNWDTDKIATQRIPCDQFSSVIVIVNPDTSITLAPQVVLQAPAAIKQDASVEAQKALQDMLYKAIVADDAAKVIEAIDAGADINGEMAGKSYISLAIAMKKYNVAKALVEKGINITNDKDLVLQALNGDNINLALLLIKNDADISTNSDTCIGRVIHHFECLQRIRRFGPIISKNDLFDLMNEFIQRGFDINKIWSYHNGVIFRDTELLKFLINHGANVNHVDNRGGFFDGKTALSGAISYDALEAVKILFQAGANIYQVITGNNKTVTALEYAIGHSSIIEFLLENGAQQ